MIFRVFQTISYNSTAEVIDLGEQTTCLGTGHYYVYGSYDKAFEAAFASGTVDTVAPCPYMTINGNDYGIEFLSNGFLLQRVDVTLGESLEIAASVIIKGGAYRLRFECGSDNVTLDTSGVTVDIYDCDFVKGGGILSGDGTDVTLNLTRCLIAGAESWGTNTATTTATDCVIIGNQGTSAGALTLTRCTVDIPSSAISSATDSLNIAGMTPTEIAAFGFLVSPLAIDSSDSTYFLPDSGGTATAWTNSTWSSWDLRLLATSSYISGGTSATSGTKVYGYDGLPRKVGGATGAYEYYAITHVFWNVENASGFNLSKSTKYYIIENADDGPQIVDVYIGGGTTIGSGVGVTAVLDEPAPYKVLWYAEDSEYWHTYWGGSKGKTTYGCQYNKRQAVCGVRFYDEDNQAYVGEPSYVYSSDTKLDGYSPMSRFDKQRQWRKYQTTLAYVDAAPTSASVCLFDQNIELADTDSTVGTIIVAGGAHVKLGNNSNGAEVILGLRATVEFDGEITAKDLKVDLSQYNLKDGAILTLDNCETTANSLDISLSQVKLNNNSSLILNNCNVIL